MKCFSGSVRINLTSSLWTCGALSERHRFPVKIRMMYIGSNYMYIFSIPKSCHSTDGVGLMMI